MWIIHSVRKLSVHVHKHYTFGFVDAPIFNFWFSLALVGNVWGDVTSHRIGFIIVIKFDITKTRLYNFDPLKPHFYIVKLGFTGVYISFLISAKNIDCGYSLEPPRRSGSNQYPQSMFWAEIWKISEFFLSQNFQFLEVKFSLYLNRLVFVMDLHVSLTELSL